LGQPEESRRIPKNPEESRRIPKNPEESRRIPKNPKNSSDGQGLAISFRLTNISHISMSVPTTWYTFSLRQSSAEIVVGTTLPPATHIASFSEMTHESKRSLADMLAWSQSENFYGLALTNANGDNKEGSLYCSLCGTWLISKTKGIQVVVFFEWVPLRHQGSCSWL
jgi:hypothetical protein